MASEFVIYLIGINVLTFLIYGIDKWKARRGKWRIPEDPLIWLAIAGGSIGALLTAKIRIIPTLTNYRLMILVQN